VVGAVEKRHGIDHERSAHSWDLAAVGDHRDAGREGSLVELQLLQDEVGLAAEVAH